MLEKKEKNLNNVSGGLWDDQTIVFKCPLCGYKKTYDTSESLISPSCPYCKVDMFIEDVGYDNSDDS